MTPEAMMAPPAAGVPAPGQAEMQAGVPTGAPMQNQSVTGDPNLDMALQQVMLALPDEAMPVVEQLLAALEPYIMPQAQPAAMPPEMMAAGMQGNIPTMAA